MTAVERLTWHYRNPFAQAVEKSRQGMPIAGITSNTVPWEILRAAGCFPVMLNPPHGPAPFADKFMEAGVFSCRIRGIFQGLVSGAWPFLDRVVIPRTSEQEHKLYLYLRETQRQGIATALPELHLYNLLHARSPEAEAYGLERTRALAERCAETNLMRAIHESNHASRAIQELLDLRQAPEPRLSGTAALPLIGAAWFMDRGEYAQLAQQAAHELAVSQPIQGARILIKGSPLNHTGLHRALESHGVVVVAEDDWWGSRSIGRAISTEGDLVRSLFEAYYFDAPSPRVFPREVADEWFLAAAARVDKVVFYLPPEDDVLGWDYPWLRNALDQRGIPHLLVREDASQELSPDCHKRIAAFVSH